MGDYRHPPMTASLQVPLTVCCRRFSNEVGSVSLLADGRHGGIERGVEAVTIECLEEAVTTNQILESGAHLDESHWTPVALSSRSSCSSILAADTSTSVIASHWTTTHEAWCSRRRGGSGSGTLSEFAKNSGASQR